MKGIFIIACIFCCCTIASGQAVAYADSIEISREKYVKEHGAVKGNNRKQIRFFPPDEKYHVPVSVERIYEAPWFKMETSGKVKKIYRTYAILTFTINDTVCRLHVYQSQQPMGIKEYAGHLFIPFTDQTSGEETYENGRYIDLTIADLENGAYLLDFNKAYNPYCAYISNIYNCPLPPEENSLPVAIRAGEMKFGKNH